MLQDEAPAPLIAHPDGNDVGAVPTSEIASSEESEPLLPSRETSLPIRDNGEPEASQKAAGIPSLQPSARVDGSGIRTETPFTCEVHPGETPEHEAHPEASINGSPGAEVVDNGIHSEDRPATPDASVAAETPYTAEQKQKQKQTSELNSDIDAGSSTSSEARPGSYGTIGPSRAQSLKQGQPGWEKSSDRPPAKLPIRFRDAVGRNFAFPWEKAKTWEGMERLIESCFNHVDFLSPWVRRGYYDLLVMMPFSMDPASDMFKGDVATVPVGLNPVPPSMMLGQATEASAPSTSGAGAATPSMTAGASISANSSDTPAANPASAPTPSLHHSAPVPTPVPSVPVGGPSASPSAPMPSSSPSQERSPVILLPELWDDMIEPGMLIQQHSEWYPLPKSYPVYKARE
ncbi:hypothetical protein F5Y15DRAFT_410460 [Xylariaceae sp. FL0016]|nr:hypothetical protein F5Y15DRAFT_410460 [Xylariaceae sp. FL0016]